MKAVLSCDLFSCRSLNIFGRPQKAKISKCGPSIDVSCLLIVNVNPRNIEVGGQRQWPSSYYAHEILS